MFLCRFMVTLLLVDHVLFSSDSQTSFTPSSKAVPKNHATNPHFAP